MVPYYERDGLTVYLGDCREVLPTLDKGSADLIVTDPPYGVAWRSGRRTERFDRIRGDDDASWVPSALGLAGRVLRESRHAYVFGGFVLPAPFVGAQAELIWDKVAIGSGNLAVPFGPAHERITFAAQGGKWAGKGGQIPARLRQGSVLRYPRPTGRGVSRHPTEKPVPLLRRLIESSSLPGEVVLDPFLGCGSTLVAAAAEGRRGVGVELDERYAATAAERLDEILDYLGAAPKGVAA